MSGQPIDTAAIGQAEEWRDIPGFPGYQVSNLGGVRGCRPRNGKGPSLNFWRPLKQGRASKGHLFVTLATGQKGGGKRRFVHRLVLEAFVGPCPPGMQARHVWTNDPTENHLDNLAWGTPTDDAADQDRHGTRRRGSQTAVAKLTEAEVLEMRRAWVDGASLTSLARRFGINYGTVWDICHGLTWTHVEVLQPTEKTRYVNRVKGKNQHRRRDERGQLLPGERKRDIRRRERAAAESG